MEASPWPLSKPDGASAESALSGVEDASPLPALQEGMLFRHLLDPSSGVDFEQIVCELPEAVEADSLERAWRRVVERHAALRTCFRWRGLPRPFLQVASRVDVPFARHDWRGLPETERESRFETFLAEDRRRGFSLDRAPLLRLALFRMDEELFRLVWSFHHAIADGRSFAPVLREVFGSGEGLPTPRPYSDYIAWLASRDMASARNFWQGRLDGLRSATSLPLPAPAVVAGDPESGEQAVSLSSEAAPKLSTLARRHGLAPSTFLYGAWALLLARYSGEGDVVFGAVSAGRDWAGADAAGLIGLFLRVFPVRTDVPAGERLIPWLKRLRAQQLASREHEYASLSEIQQWCGWPAASPLLESLLVFDRSDFRSVLRGLPGAWSRRDFRLIERTGYPLTVYATFEPRLEIRIVYDRKRFADTAISRMVGHLRTLIEAMAEDPDRTLSEIPMLTEGERRMLLEDWNRTSAALPLEPSVARQVEARAARAPEDVAIVCGSRRLTYRELNGRANRLARFLRTLGVGPGVLVAVGIERSIEMVVTLLGVLKAGGAYVPLDPDLPRQRLAILLEDSDARVIVTRRGLMPRLPENGAARSVCLESEAAAIARQSAENLGDTPGADDLAYVIYTSGSTGRPKGVMVTHGNVVNFFAGMDRVLRPPERPGVWLALTSIGFDISVLELLWTLARGFRVVVLPGQARALSFLTPRGGPARENASIPALLEEHGVTHVQCTPTLARMFTEEADSREALAGVAEFLVGGEPLSPSLAQALLRVVPGTVRNMYGPTETTVWSTTHRVVFGEDPVPIGRPIANTRVYVLDRHLEPVPVGVPGEIYLGGAGVARGYWRRPELTESRFLPDPFSREAGRLYRTGDRARYREDGEIEFLGRLDDQVKIRGHRIEPGEVERELQRHAGVREAAVVSREDGSAGRRLVAYFTAAGSSPPSAEELRRNLQESLPGPFVPSALVRLDELPRTPNGKIDRRALVERRMSERSRPEDPKPAPATVLEEEMARIWSSVLGVSSIGAREDFFELGGHSLSAIRLLSRVEAEFGVEVPLRTLLAEPTVAGLAAAVAGLRGQDARGALSPSLAASLGGHRSEPFPLTSVQQASWAGRGKSFEMGNVPTQTYVEVDVLDLDLARAEVALRRLIERHDMLRARVLPDGRQEVLETVAPYRIDVLDLSGQDEDSVARQLEVTRERFSRAGRDAHEWPLFDVRATVFGRSTRVHLTVDGLIVDAKSWKILEREFLRLYRDPEASLPELDIAFRDSVLADVAERSSERFRGSREYWMSRLESLPPGPALPLARSPGSLERPRFTRRAASLEPRLWRRLTERAALSGLTAPVVLLAAFAEILALWSRHARLTINVPTFRRRPLHPRIDDVVGVFTSLTLLEIDSPRGTFRERARAIQARLWEDLDHADFGAVEVIREIARARERAGFPVVFTSLLFSGGEEEASSSEPMPFRFVYGLNQSPQVWLEQEVSEHGGTLLVSWNAVDDLFPAGLLDDMFAASFGLIEDLASSEEAWERSWAESARALVPADDLVERARVNATDSPLAPLLLHELFEEQAARRPEAVAVAAGERELTYGELDRLSGLLARRLSERGVAPNALVGIVMEKGWEQVVAVLAVLRSGAAFLPIEHPLPAERFRYLLENGEVSIVLTQSGLEERLPWPSGVVRICVDRQEPDDERPRSARVQSPEDLAYVMYTSGSTGSPKGVAISHRGAVNTILDINERFGVGPGDRVFALSSLAFDLSVYDVFGALAAGATIVLPEESGVHDPSHWAEVVKRERVTVWNSVPALMKLLVERVAGRPELFPESLRLVLLSGDWTPVSLPGEIHAIAPAAAVVSLGGATEASIWSILHPIDRVDPSWKSIPYGKPMRNQSFHVFNEALEPSPVWVPGDLYIGGIGLAAGYWRDEEKTRASFRTHPRTGERLYRTGDLGRYLPGGSIEFLGREDGQVKVLGTRVELGEIEAGLARHPAVASAVVVARGEWNRELSAYVVPRSGARVTQAELRAFLRERLPEVLVPAAFLILERLPLTRNGKVDRAALPVPGGISQRGARAADLAGDAEGIAASVASILRVPRVEPEANLLDMGASSVDLIRIANLLEKTLGRRPSIGDLYRAPTLTALLRAPAESPGGRDLDSALLAPISQQHREERSG